MKKGYTYDDLLIKPKRSNLKSRSNVDTEVELFSDFRIEKPIISANMSTVTEEEMGNAMSDAGGLGIVHRFVDIEKQVEKIEKIEGKCGGSVGVDEDYIKNARDIIEAGANFVCVDIAHGHLEKCLNAVEEIREEYPHINIMAGNVATEQGALDLYKKGADCVKVGIGGGSMCETRRVAGVGVPQATAVMEASKAKKTAKIDNFFAREEYTPDKPTIVADGGIRQPGDAVKALVLGADAVMVGGLFASCEESCAEEVTIGGEVHKVCYGMASEEAREKRDSESRGAAVEGDKGVKKKDGSVKEKVNVIAKGIRSGFSYCGCRNINEVREKISDEDIIRVSNSTMKRNGAFGCE